MPALPGPAVAMQAWANPGNARFAHMVKKYENVLGEIDKRFSPLQNNLFCCSPVVAANIQKRNVSHCCSAIVNPLPWLPASIMHMHLNFGRLFYIIEDWVITHQRYSAWPPSASKICTWCSQCIDTVEISISTTYSPASAHILTLPVLTALCERSFFCIKRVKTYRRTSMTWNRLCGLGLMSIENDITRDDNFLDDVVRKFKNNSAAEEKQRRIALWRFSILSDLNWLTYSTFVCSILSCFYLTACIACHAIYPS